MCSYVIQCENRIKWAFGINNLKVCLHIIVVSVYQNSPLLLFECNEQNLDICGIENVSWFNISLC